MSDTPWTLADLKRQARQHLESLRLAGVEWLPAASPLQMRVAAAEAAPAATAAPVVQTDDAALLTLPAADLTLEQRRTGLTLVAQRVAACTRCPELSSTRTQTVFADGQIPVDLCVIGEAPGADEDAQGKPFVGKAGQLLNNILAACGLKREEVYICNTLKCRPPSNRTPKPEESANCREYLMRQLELVQPKFICAMGGSAAQSLLNTTSSLGALRGRLHDYNGIPVLCTYHPSYLLPHRNPAKKRDVWEDMKFLMARMGRTIPPHSGTRS